MKKEKWIITTIALLIIVCILAGFVFFLLLEHRANKILLKKLAMTTPGIYLTEIRDELGPQMHEFSQLDKVLSWGSIKDKQFCKGKKLYWFYASTPPCRAIQIYTDVNDVIVFSTWHGL
ncbi:MAG: hypothetical protein ACYTBP_05215 [Planctomycetota bacterium]|jgi:hypothetical protein